MNFKELGANLGLDEDEYRELVELFVETGSADYERLQSALAVNDLDQILRCAHTIKGAAGNLGLTDIQEVAARIEKGAGDHHLEGMQDDIQTLASQMQAVNAFINAA